MKFEDFNEFWAGCFGWKLTKANGLDEWRRFVENEYSNDRALIETVEEFAKPYAEAIDEMRPTRDLVPTLAAVRARYFATIKARKIRWDMEKGGGNPGAGCSMCGGGGYLVGLAPATNDRQELRAPEHVMDIELEYAYPGVQMYPCPICHAGMYDKNPERAARVRKNCLPMNVPIGHPANPHDHAVCGKELLMEAMKARMGVTEKPGNNNIRAEIDSIIGKNNGNAVLTRVFGRGGKLSLEDAFPLQDALKTQINDIDEEERRITAELAGKFSGDR